MIIQKPLKLILFFIPLCFVAGCRFSPSNEDIVNWLRQNCADQPVNCIALQNKDGEFGVVDTNARWIVEPKYERLAVFQGTNIFYTINHQNEIILRTLKGDSLNTGMTENPDMILEKDGLWVIIKKGAKRCLNARTGRYFDASNYQYISVSDSVLRVKKDGKYGFVDYDNNELVPFIFDDASVFVNGRASVKKNGLWGVINKSGEQLLDCTYQSPLQFSADLMYSYINGKKIWIDSAGQTVCLKTGDRALKSYSGQSFSFKENDRYGIIDTSGEVCAQPLYAEMYPFMENGYCWAMDRGEWVLLDRFGKQVSDHAFRDTGTATGLPGWYSVETAESGHCLYSVHGCLKCPEVQ